MLVEQGESETRESSDVTPPSAKPSLSPSDLGPETYRLLFDKCPLPMWVFDLETYLFLAVNEAAVSHYGYTREEFLAMKVLDIRPPEEVGPTVKFLREHPEDSDALSEKYVTTHRRKNGETFQVELSWETITTGDRHARIILAVDITERVKAEKAIASTTVRLNAVVKATSDAIWDWDLANNTLAWSDGLQRLFGHVTPGGIVNIEWWEELIHPEDRASVLSGINQYIQGDETFWSDVYRFRNADASYSYVEDRATILRDQNGRATRLVGGLADITDRITAEKERELTDQRFRAVARVTNDAVWDWNLKTNEVHWNEGVHTLFQYPHGEVAPTAEWWISHIHPEDRDRIAHSIHTAIDSGAIEWREEYRFLRGDGSNAFVLDRGAILRDQDGVALRMVGGMSDVTPLVNATRQIEEYKTFLEKAQEAGNMGSWKCGTGDDNDFLVWSSGVFRIFGLDMDQFTGKLADFYNRVHPDDLPLLQTSDEGIPWRDWPQAIEHRIIRPDGTIRWVTQRAEIIPADEKGKVQFVGVVEDITESREAKDALRRAEEKFQSAVNFGPIGFITGNMDGVITDANDAFLQMVGIPRERLLNGGIHAGEITVEDVLANGLSEGDVRAIAQLQETNHYDPYEKSFKRSDGSIVDVMIGGVLLNDGTGETLNFVLDISELVQTRGALLEANSSLEQKVAERTAILHDQYRRMAALKEEADIARADADSANRAKSDFLSRMSHELRTPMNAILGFAQLLEMDNLPEDSSSSVAQILKAGDHLLVLINEVLDLSRIESGKLSISPERIRIREIIAEVVDLCGPTFPKYGVTVEWDRESSEEQFVMGDASRLRQVFINLISNATKYNRKGGTIHIRVDDLRDGYWSVSIKDTGIGIPAGRMDRLFKPFDRLGREMTDIEGSGLGLALSKRLIDVMNGHFNIESKVGEGTTVRVDLVAVAPPSEGSDPYNPSTPIQVPRMIDGPRRTVLYIEDNLSNVELVSRIFKATGGVHLLTALQGGAGLDMALENKPDLILLDLNLPDIEGIGVLRRLRADPRTDRIPVIIITADATVGQRERLLHEGADGYLAKPINVTDFISKVRIILDKEMV